jgi:hypothetical protein
MSTHYDRTRAAVRIPTDEPTSASAWSSSRLGDPGIASRSVSEPDDFGFDETPLELKPRSTRKIAWAAAAAVGTIGAGILVGAVLFGGAGPSQPTQTGVVPGANVQTVNPNAPSADPPDAGPAPAAPAPDPGQAPVGTPGTDGGAPSVGDPGAPAVGGGSAPAATDPTDGGSDPAPQAGGPAAGPGDAPGTPYVPGVVVAPDLNMPSGGRPPGAHSGGPQKGGGGKGFSGGGGNSKSSTGGGKTSAAPQPPSTYKRAIPNPCIPLSKCK